MAVANRKGRRRVTWATTLLVAAVAITGSLIAFLGTAGGSSSPRSTDPGPGITQLPSNRRSRASKIPPYTVYYFGATFEGLPVTEVSRMAEPPDPESPEDGRQDDVAYIYGLCPRYPPGSPASQVEGGCLPPLQVSSTPLCQAHAALYTMPGDTWDSSVPYPHVKLRIKGVPAASFHGGTRRYPQPTILEIYTANTTISIKGTDGKQVRRAADSIRLARARDIPRVGKTLSHVSKVGVPPVIRRLKAPNAKVLRSTRPCS